jgi:signal transduction histidine kinase
MLGTRAFEVLGAPFEPPFLAKLVKVVDRREPLEDEHVVLKASGPIWLQSSSVAVGDGVAVSFRDISARKAADEAARLAEARLRRVSDAAPGVLYQYRLRPDGTDDFPFISARTTDLIGVPSSRIREDASAAWSRVVEDDRDRLTQSIGRAALQGAIWSDEFRVLHVDGSVRWVRGYAVPEEPAEDGSVTWNGLLLDATEVKRLEEQFLQAQKMESVGRLAGGVAHDFNNLLSAILGYAELAETHVPDGHPARPLLENLQLAAERGAALTRRLLAFARRPAAESRHSDLNAAFVGLRAMLEALIGEDIEIVERLAEESLPTRIDPTSLEQVVVNLVVNARDAMPEGGRLWVETARTSLDDRTAAAYGVTPGPFALLSVSDSGHGMDAETQRRVFEPFFTTKEPGKGTGLGLATCYGIVHQCGGHITLESAPRRGSKFVVYLPLSEEPVESAAAKRSLATGATAGTETVLLVEDEPLVRRIAAAALESHGYTVIEASDGEEALRVVDGRLQSVHLLLTDVVMPRMSGPSLARRLLSLRGDLKILYMSGYTGDARLTAAGNTPHEILQKPFTPTVLARKVREVLDAPQG